MRENLFAIEKRKYRGVWEVLFFALVSAVSLGIAAANLYAGGDGDALFRRLSAVDSFLFIKIIVEPIFLAAVAGRSVEIESDRDMWKMIRTAGIDLDKVYATKFCYSLSKVAVYQAVEWAALLVLISVWVPGPLPWGRIVFSYAGQFCVSFLLLAVHYVLALRRGEARTSAAVALVGTLAGLIFLFLPDVFSLVNPYSWYGRLMQVGYDYTGGEPVRYLMALSYGIPIVAVLLGVAVLYGGIKRGVRE